MMTYQPMDQIAEIRQIEQEVSKHHQELVAAIQEMAKLTDEMYAAHGRQFVVGGTAYKLVTRARGYGMGGNMEWLEVDNAVKVL